MLRAGLALTPDYLETRDPAAVKNLMDTGIALGRRFRALKLWMVLRYFGAAGMRSRVADHIRLAQTFASWVEADRDFELLAPPSLSVVCFRAAPRDLRDGAALDALNTEILDRVNHSGEVYLSHTTLRGRTALRLAVANIRTTGAHVARAWDILRHSLRTVRPPLGSRP